MRRLLVLAMLVACGSTEETVTTTETAPVTAGMAIPMTTPATARARVASIRVNPRCSRRMAFLHWTPPCSGNRVVRRIGGHRATGSENTELAGRLD